MKGSILLLVCLALLSMVLCAAAEDAVHETAQFMKNAWDPEGPIGYWGGDAEHPPTFFLYMRYQPWYEGSDTVRREGVTLLGCIAPIIRTLVGGTATTVAEGLVQPGDCMPSRDAQRLLLHLLFPGEKRQFL